MSVAYSDLKLLEVVEGRVDSRVQNFHGDYIIGPFLLDSMECLVRIVDLPTELLLHIASFLDFPAILQVQKVIYSLLLCRYSGER